TEVEALSPEGLRELIQKVMETPSYGERARFFEQVIARTRGLDIAADVIERALGAERLARPLREAGSQRAHAPTTARHRHPIRETSPSRPRRPATTTRATG